MNSDISILFTDNSRYYNEIHQLFKSLNIGLKKPGWIEWKYGANPDGMPLIGLALCNDKIVTVQTFLPRTFVRGDATIQTVQAMDAVTHPDFRRQGIYQRIWSESNTVLREKNLVLTAFAAVRDKSIGALRKNNLLEFGPLRPLCRILRPAALVARKLGGKGGFWGGSLVRAVDHVASAFIPIKKTAIRVVPIQRFAADEAFDAACVYGRRSAAYLNWRFVENPVHRFVNLKFYRDTEDIGFCAIQIPSDSPNPVIFDFVARSSVQECIYALTGYIRDKFAAACCIFFRVFDGHAFLQQFQRCGFFALRPDLFMFTQQEQRDLPPDRMGVYVTLGDTDW